MEKTLNVRHSSATKKVYEWPIQVYEWPIQKTSYNEWRVVGVKSEFGALLLASMNPQLTDTKV